MLFPKPCIINVGNPQLELHFQSTTQKNLSRAPKKKVTACVWHPRQPQPDPVVTLCNDHKFVIQAFRPVIPDYFKGELMEQRGILLLVSWSLCGPAGGSFRAKLLDRGAWRSSAATGRSCGVMAAPGTMGRSAPRAGACCHCHRVTCCTAPATHLALWWGLPGGAGMCGWAWS